MKKNIIILIIIHISLVVISQNTYVSGKIINPKKNKIKLIFASTIFTQADCKLKTKLDKKDNFSFELDLKNPRNYYLKYADNYIELFLLPNDSIHLVITQKENGFLLEFSGKGYENSKYLNDEENYFAQKYNDDRYYDYKTFNVIEPFSRELRDERIKYLHEYETEGSLSKFFERYQLFNIKLDYLDRTIITTWFNNDSSISKIDKEKVIFESYHDSLIQEVSFIKTGSRYEDNVERILSFKQNFGKEIRKMETSEWLRKRYEFIKKELLQDVFEMQAALFFIENLNLKTKNILQKLFIDYKKNCDDIEFLNAVQSEFDRYNDSKIEFPEKIDVLTIDSSKVKLKSVLKNYKNKVVYVDIWATWCKPCLLGMPHNIKLQSKYKDKDIVFLFLATRSDFKDWKETIDRLGITGEHFLIGDDNVEIFERDLFLKGYPTYFLIDKEGNVKETYSSEEKELQSQIEKLLTD